MTEDIIERGTVKSDGTLFTIIERINQQGSVGVTELADEIGLAKSSVHRHLKTLEQYGYVVKDDDRYRLSFKFLTIGGLVRANNPLCQHASQHVQRLANETDRLGTFSIKESQHGIFTHVHNDKYGISDDNPLGSQFHLHQNASGKAMLARLSDDEICQIIDQQGLPSRTKNTIRNREELLEEIEEVREKGFATSIEERVEGVDAISASVYDAERDLLGALSITAPGNQVTKQDIEENYGSLLVETANEFELQIRYR